MQVLNSATSYIKNNPKERQNLSQPENSIKYYEDLLKKTRLESHLIEKEAGNPERFSELSRKSIIEKQKQSLQEYKDEKNEKMSNENLLEVVTHNPYTNRYTIIEFYENLLKEKSPMQDEYLSNQDRYNGSDLSHYFSVDPVKNLSRPTIKSIIENQKQSLQEHKDEENEKMSNENLVDGVTYNPYTDKYTLVMDDYGVAKREFKHIVLIDNSTKIISDKPITKEYLEERYEKIQHFLKTEYSEFSKKVAADNSILVDIGIGMGGFSQRDAWGIVKIDGKYIEIDADEFKRHYQIYLNEKAGMSIKEDSEISVYYKELNGIEPSFENAEKFEYYARKWKGSHFLEMYRQISLAVNLGLVEEGNQTLLPELYQTHKASFAFKNVENDILSQAVLDSIGSEYSGVMEGIMYDVLFGPNNDSFQNRLNEFAKELKSNPSKYPSVNSNFTFTGDITLDEESTQEYKNFITNTLIDFIEKQKSDYVSGNHPIKDPYRKGWSVAYSFDVIINNLKDSKITA